MLSKLSHVLRNVTSIGFENTWFQTPLDSYSLKTCRYVQLNSALIKHTYSVLLYKHKLLSIVNFNSDVKQKISIFIFIKHTHSYQSAAPWRSYCCLEAVSGLQTSPALSGGRRYENVWQHLYKYSFLDCGCKETKHTYLHKSILGRLFTTIYTIYTININYKNVLFILFQPSAKSICNGEAEEAASQNTENRTTPADKKSCSQLIPRDKE